MKAALLSLGFFLVSLPLAQAHLETGTYAGSTASGEECMMLVLSHFYENGQAHPLNERASVSAGGDTYKVAHPPMVDLAESKVHFNHDVFEGVLATSKGGRALVIEMSHEAGADGPKAFHILDHQWRANAREKFSCMNLKFQR